MIAEVPGGAARHLDDASLAALADGALSEEAARAARDHLDGCPDCGGRAGALDELKARLAQAPDPDPDRVDAIVEAARSSPGRRAPSLAVLLPTALVPAGLVAAAMLVAWPSPPKTDAGEFTARSGGAADRPDDAPVLVRGRAAGVLALPLEPGLVLESGAALSLSVSPLGRLEPGQHLAVFVRDADGRVTWVAPAWTNPDAPPSAIEESGLDSGRFVEVPGPLPSGVLEVGTLVLDRALTVDVLDGKLEAGWEPRADGELGVVRAARQLVEVRAR